MNHELELQAARINYPRVSDITFPFERAALDLISLEVLAKAAERGTTVHSYCTAFLRNDFVPEPQAEINAYVESFKLAWKTLGEVEVLLTESRLYDDLKGFSGKPDLVIKDKEEVVWLIDFKTSAQPSPIWPIKLSAYIHLLAENGFKNIGGAHIFQLKCSKKWSDEEKTKRLYKPANPKIFTWDSEELGKYYREYFAPALRWYELMKK